MKTILLVVLVVVSGCGSSGLSVGDTCSWTMTEPATSGTTNDCKRASPEFGFIAHSPAANISFAIPAGGHVFNMAAYPGWLVYGDSSGQCGEWSSGTVTVHALPPDWHISVDVTCNQDQRVLHLAGDVYGHYAD